MHSSKSASNNRANRLRGEPQQEEEEDDSGSGGGVRQPVFSASEVAAAFSFGSGGSSGSAGSGGLFGGGGGVGRALFGDSGEEDDEL